MQTTQHQQTRAVAAHIASIRSTAEAAGVIAPHYTDFMILCPYNSQVQDVADTLTEEYGIPTRIQQQRAIPESVWSFILALRLIDGDSLALRQWLPVVGLDAPVLAESRRTALQAGINLYEHCSSLETQELKDLFASIENLKGSLMDPAAFGESVLRFPGLQVDDDVRHAVSIVAEYCPAIRRMIGKIYEEYGVLERDEDQADSPEANAVLVATMHRSKGLEKDYVYVMWLDDRFMPGAGRDYEEERRVLYVAITRAKKDVVLTFQERYEKGRYYGDRAMSPFLKSIQAHLDIRRFTAKDLA